MSSLLSRWLTWFAFCPTCRRVKQVDYNTSVEIAQIICVECSPHFWAGYRHAVCNEPGPDPWDEYRKEVGK